MAAHDRRLEQLLEAATSAFRRPDREGRIAPSPHWADLSPAQRHELFERVLESRALEAAMDDDGLSSTARTVLEHAAGLAQLG